MKRIIHKKKAYKIAAITLLASTMLGEVMPFAAYAAQAQAEVDETMYLNLELPCILFQSSRDIA